MLEQVFELADVCLCHDQEVVISQLCWSRGSMVMTRFVSAAACGWELHMDCIVAAEDSSHWSEQLGESTGAILHQSSHSCRSSSACRFAASSSSSRMIDGLLPFGLPRLDRTLTPGSQGTQGTRTRSLRYKLGVMSAVVSYRLLLVRAARCAQSLSPKGLAVLEVFERSYQLE